MKQLYRSTTSKRVIDYFIVNQDAQFLSKDVCISLKVKMNVNIDQKVVTKFMKNEISCHSSKLYLDKYKLMLVNTTITKYYFNNMAKQLDKIE